MHTCRHINELFACQVSDGYLVKQAGSSGSNFSWFWQLMDDKFGPLVTCIFRSETSGLCPRITQQRENESFWNFFPRNVWQLSVISAQFQINSWKSTLHINNYWLPIQKIWPFSDGYLVKQASSSGSNFSRFWQLMDDKFNLWWLA